MCELADRFWSQVSRDGECWEWQGLLNGRGYGVFRFSGMKGMAHRVAYSLTHGTHAESQLICHSCDNRSCVNPAHLFHGSHADNMADMVQKGRSLAGERNPRARLTRSQVEEIRVVYAATAMGQKQLAKQYGVAQSTVGRLLRGEAWR